MAHLDDLDLELLRTGEGTPGTEAHLRACPACRERLVFFEEMARALGADPVPIPAEVDGRIASLIAYRAAVIRRGRVLRRVVLPLAAAAAVALFVLANQPGVAPHRSDVTGDGRLDILDAFAVARALEQGDPRAEWDQNGDGLVDQTDVDLLALAAVSSPSGGAL